jgi:hypothetical protein
VTDPLATFFAAGLPPFLGVDFAAPRVGVRLAVGDSPSDAAPRRAEPKPERRPDMPSASWPVTPAAARVPAFIASTASSGPWAAATSIAELAAGPIRVPAVRARLARSSRTFCDSPFRPRAVSATASRKSLSMERIDSMKEPTSPFVMRLPAAFAFRHAVSALRMDASTASLIPSKA